MKPFTATQDPPEMIEPPPRFSTAAPRWDLAFLGILGYLVVEYTRLAAMYPILRPLALGKVVVAICFLGWLISPRIATAGRSGSRLLELAVWLFVLVCFVSSCFAEYSSQAWDQFLDVLRLVVVYFLIGRVVNSSWRVRAFALVLLLLNLKLAQFAIRSYSAGLAYGRSETFMASRGVGAGSTGFFGNPGDLGVAMCVVWPLAGMLFLGESKKLARLIYLTSFVAFSGAILVCGSRGAFVGAILTGLVAAARNLRRFGIALLFLMLVPGLFYLLPEASKARLRSALHWEADRTATIRMQLWKAGLRMFKDHPVVGVGPANFPPNYADNYAGPGEEPKNWVPHSIYIQALSELGLPGMIALLLMIGSFFRLNARTLNKYGPLGKGQKRPFEYYLAQGLNLSMVGYMISGAFLAVLYYPHLWILLGLSVGLSTASLRERAAESVAGAESEGPSLALPAPG